MHFNNLRTRHTKKAKFANSTELDEAAHNEIYNSK